MFQQGVLQQVRPVKCLIEYLAGVCHGLEVHMINAAMSALAFQRTTVIWFQHIH